MPFRVPYAAGHDARSTRHKMLATEERNVAAVNVARSGLVVGLAKKSFRLSWLRNPSLFLRSRPFGYHLGRQERLFDHVLDVPHACEKLSIMMLELVPVPVSITVSRV
jgi:hypothetical protein